MITSENWKVLLDGYGDNENGDVISKDGEIIGTWSLVDHVFCTFTPNGAKDHMFFEPFVGILCSLIAEWHAGRG